MTADKCPIWGTPATIAERNGFLHFEIDSPRTGGKFSMMRNTLDDFNGNIQNNDGLRARLTTWLINQRRQGTESPEITYETIEQIERQKPLPVHERADSLLRYFQQKSPFISSAVLCRLNDPVDHIFQETLAWSESTSEDEVYYLLQYLGERGWVNKETAKGPFPRIILTGDGYARLAEMATKQVNSSQGFVAMWFDDTMKSAYIDGIEPGIEDAGYKPLRIDKKDHINKIDDEIIAEIRRSRFVVADFTHGDSGPRGGVYYEAGFAHGLNIPVFFTCHKDKMNEIHFDTQQYNHIDWTTPEELRKRLAVRISAVIGDGPHKSRTGTL